MLHRYGAYRESSAAVAQGDTVFQYQFNFKVVEVMMMVVVMMLMMVMVMMMMMVMMMVMVMVMVMVMMAQGTHGYPEAITGDNSNFGVCHSDELYYFWR